MNHIQVGRRATGTRPGESPFTGRIEEIRENGEHGEGLVMLRDGDRREAYVPSQLEVLGIVAETRDRVRHVGPTPTVPDMTREEVDFQAFGRSVHELRQLGNALEHEFVRYDELVHKVEMPDAPLPPTVVAALEAWRAEERQNGHAPAGESLDVPAFIEQGTSPRDAVR